MKLCPLVDELALYDVVNTPGVAADLSHISSTAVSRSPRATGQPEHVKLISDLQKITGYLPKDDGGKAAMKDADIIIIPAGIPRK